VYGTYLGGSGSELGFGVAVDGQGQAVVVGITDSANFPLQSPVQTQRGGADVFITKLNAAGNGMVYSTYLGGTASEHSLGGHRMGVAIDDGGNAYVTGYTGHVNNAADGFPTTPGAFQRNYIFHGEGFVTKLNAAGQIVYSTLFGGGVWDNGNAIAVDGAGNAYVVGSTGSNTNFPLTASGYDKTYGGGLTDGFFLKLNAAGSQVLYSTLIGGSGNDNATALALAPDGTVYVTGGSASADDPGTPAFEGFVTTNGTLMNGASDAFVQRINPKASGAASLMYSTLFGGSDRENEWQSGGVGVDPAGNVYFTGSTKSTDLPVVNAVQPARRGLWDIFIAKINVNGTLGYCTYFSGSGGVGNGLVVNSFGDAYVTGQTSGHQMQLLNPIQTYASNRLDSDGFVVKLGPTGQLKFSTYLGGNGQENSAFFSGMGGLVLDAAGDLYVTGSTTSTSAGAVPFPTLGPVQANNGGGEDAFLVKISLSGGIGKPSNLSATTISGTQINLAWADNSNNETGFEVWRKAGSDSFAPVGTAAANATSFNDTGLSGNTAYTYKVRAFNGDGYSLFSDTAAATTLPGPPPAPDQVSVAPLSQTSLQVSWRDNGTNETAFHVERKAPGESFTEIGTAGANQTSLTDTGLTANTTYTYRVRAKNTGGFSPYSADSVGTTLPNAPAAPASLAATPASYSQVDLTWPDVAGEDSYTVERKNGAAWTVMAVVGANTTSYSSGGLSGGTQYTYRVKAGNDGGESAYSPEASATTPPGPPAAPSNLTASAVSQTRIDLTWSDNSPSETGFEIERKPQGGAWALIHTTAANATSYSDTTGLSAASQYSYRVRATNAQGDSPESNEAGATTLPNPPNAPSNLAVAINGSGLRLTWSDGSANETGFKIERKIGGGDFIQIGTVGANVTQFTDNSPGTTTSAYRVKATNTGGDSAPSNEVQFSPPTGKLKVKTKVSFGTVRLGSQKLKNLVLQNLSRTDSLRVTVPSPSAPYSIAGSGGTHVIPPRGKVTVSLRYMPFAVGTSTRTLQLTSSDPAKPAVSVTLTGKGR
jgi:fibronectin type 3 domain-containing protein